MEPTDDDRKIEVKRQLVQSRRLQSAALDKTTNASANSFPNWKQSKTNRVRRSRAAIAKYPARAYSGPHRRVVPDFYRRQRACSSRLLSRVIHATPNRHHKIYRGGRRCDGGRYFGNFHLGRNQAVGRGNGSRASPGPLSCLHSQAVLEIVKAEVSADALRECCATTGLPEMQNCSSVIREAT